MILTCYLNALCEFEVNTYINKLLLTRAGDASFCGFDSGPSASLWSPLAEPHSHVWINTWSIVKIHKAMPYIRNSLLPSANIIFNCVAIIIQVIWHVLLHLLGTGSFNLWLWNVKVTQLSAVYSRFKIQFFIGITLHRILPTTFINVIFLNTNETFQHVSYSKYSFDIKMLSAIVAGSLNKQQTLSLTIYKPLGNFFILKRWVLIT